MIEPTRLVVVRHGETDWNVEQRIQGHTDIPLNDTGRRQAAQAAAALADEGLARVYSSDLARALATAQAIATRAGVPLETHTGLRERAFGRFEGVTFRELEQRWPDDTLRWRRRDPGFAPGGGEVLRDFFERSVATALAIAARHPGEAIALVAHGGVLDCLYRAATGQALDAPRSWPLANASINRLLAVDGRLVLVGWNDAGHLEAAPTEGG